MHLVQLKITKSLFIKFSAASSINGLKGHLKDEPRKDTPIFLHMKTLEINFTHSFAREKKNISPTCPLLNSTFTNIFGPWSSKQIDKAVSPADHPTEWVIKKTP